MPEQLTLEPGAEAAGQRLDRYVSYALEQTRSSIQNWLEQGLVMVNGRCEGKNYRLREKDRITIAMPEPAPCAAQAEEIPLDIILPPGIPPEPLSMLCWLTAARVYPASMVLCARESFTVLIRIPVDC